MRRGSTGCREFAIVWRIMVPRAMPAHGRRSASSRWSRTGTIIFWPLIVIADRDLAPPPLGVAVFPQRGGRHDFGPLMAGTVIITAPLVIAFLLAQRRFIEGMTMTGIKGDEARRQEETSMKRRTFARRQRRRRRSPAAPAARPVGDRDHGPVPSPDLFKEPLEQIVARVHGGAIPTSR